ncbi:hypothetical protein OKW38_005169 [Paraburkholderia sp. MM5496-R1]|uniref:hypothetical protein n=1 Tax=unclassified Paraburkholderia TaxID=2615204 RepID=UPI001620F340|nr:MULTISPECIES: hypothetical protein [unclassified Paraburkholderia]MBB5413889.1 hypothetical protein [Paraburkholderia sp. HC6.4b]MBB5456322.1 hypothetical protein [Paraburkholderia sp. Kb1A]
MNWLTPLASLLGAVVGASVGASLTHFLIARREAAKITRDLKYLALRIAFLLEHFTVACASSLLDAKNYDGSNGAIGTKLENLPELAAFPLDGDYSVFERPLLTQVLSFRLKVESANHSIAFEQNLSGEREAHGACQAVCLRMGLEASKLADAVRNAYHLAPFELETTLWDYKAYLKRQRGLKRTIDLANSATDA